MELMLDMKENTLYQIPPLETLLQMIRKELNEAGISIRELAELLEADFERNFDRGNLWYKLHGKKAISVDEVSYITALVLERTASLPQKPVSEIYVSSNDVITAKTCDTVSKAISDMKSHNFSQLPVFDEDTGSWGIITEFSIMKRMLAPLNPKKSMKKTSGKSSYKYNWLKNLKEMSIKEAQIIDEVPTYPLNTPIAEIAQALLFHYAILIIEKNRKIGLVTRADFLEKIENP